MKNLNSIESIIRSRRRSKILGLTVFVVLFSLTIYFSYSRYSSSKAQEAFIAYTLVNEAKSKMQEVFSNSILATELLAMLVQEYDSIENFEIVASKIMESQTNLHAIELMPGGIICCVYPLEGNESAVGYNVLKDTARNREAEEAISRGELFFAGPLELKQGGVAVVGRLPIKKDEKFWGFSAVLIKLTTLLDAAGIDSLTHKGFVFQLSKKNPNTGKEEYFVNGTSSDDISYTSQITIPAGEWRLSAISVDSWQPFLQSLPIFVFGLLLAAVGGAFVREVYQRHQTLDDKLNETEKKYREVFDNSTEGIYRSSMEGKLILVNPSFVKIFGHTSAQEMMEEVDDIGKHMYFKPEDREKFLGELLIRGRVSKLEIQSKAKDNKIIWISVNAHLVYEKGNRIEYIEGTVSDITVRKNDRDKLDAQYNVLMKYAFINSHQVRAHVATLLGLTNLFNDGHLSPDEQKMVMDQIGKETALLDKVIRELSSMINKVEDN